MYRSYLKFVCMAIILLLSLANFPASAQEPRVIISTDIGGTDPDDNQSLIHLMMYSDRVQIEGIISSPYGKGRKHEILRMIDIYEKDYQKLKKHNTQLASPDQLRLVSKQGVIASAPFQGYTSASEGSQWIVTCAKKTSNQPLWVLVWGGLEDLAQALHDAPEIEKNLRVFWIGGPNKKWSTNAYDYIASQHPNLWFIESNATYRGWFMEDPKTDGPLSQQQYYVNHIKGHGHMAADFINYYKGQIKMGDTPSLGYLLHGEPEDPTKPSWGGQHHAITYSSKHIYRGISTLKDTVPTYSVIEWHFKGPQSQIPADSICFWLDIQGDSLPGYHIGGDNYAVRYSPKQKAVFRYRVRSVLEEINGLEGVFVSTPPWPGAPNKDDYALGKNWYGDLLEPAYFLEGQQGARTLSRHRSDFLLDWAARWRWID